MVAELTKNRSLVYGDGTIEVQRDTGSLQALQFEENKKASL